MHKPETDTIHAVLTKRHGEAYGKGFWAEWVRAVFYCERHGLVRVTQPGTGTEGPASFIITAFGQRVIGDALEGREGFRVRQIAALKLLLPPASTL